MLAVVHQPQSRRFVVEVAGRESWLRYEPSGGAGVLDFTSTYVPAELRGRGIAGRLTQVALDWAREHGYRVVPSCSYVAAWIARHPAYAELVAP
jgi:predicted GNAT family acetyltransferase